MRLAQHKQTHLKPISAGRRPVHRRRRRGMILLVVLVVISVLALISVGFSYRMNAERIATQSLQDTQQARFAAESGLSRALLLLRDERTDVTRYYNNPESFRRVPVWKPDSQGGMGGTETTVHKQVVANEPCWRYSIVSYERQREDKVIIRYGLTDESSKININQASRGELLRLVKAVEPYLRETPPEALVDCLLDWRSPGEEPITPAGAKTSWYMTRLGYGCKGRPFDSVEELLMVKNWNATLLYGEDANRNGYLDENEDDGEDGAYPPDNGDGELNRGLLPFMTVYSWDWDSANDNKLRVDINSFPWEQLETGEIPKQYEYLRTELTPETVQFLVEAKKRGYQFKSIGELWGLEVFEDGTSNMDEVWEEFNLEVEEENALPQSEEQNQVEETQPEDTQPEDGGGGNPQDPQDPQEPGDSNDSQNPRTPREDDPSETDDRDPPGPRRPNRPGNPRSTQVNPQMPWLAAHMKTVIAVSTLAQNRPRTRDFGPRPGQGSGDPNHVEPEYPSDDSNAGNRGGDGDGDRSPRRGGDRRPDGRGSGRNDGGRGDRDAERDGERGGERDGRGGNGDNGAADTRPDGAGEPMSEEERLRRRGVGIQFPQNPEQMQVLMDRLTVRPLMHTRGRVPGLINANTAPFEVLRTIIGLTDEDAMAIVARRQGLPAAEMRTPAWLVTAGALSPTKFGVVSNKLTARSLQFSADIIGFADHVGTYKRLQVILEMQGHIAQVRYYRDISSLGIGYPVRDDERSDGLVYQPQ